MAYVNLATLTGISRELEKLQVEFTFVGGRDHAIKTAGPKTLGDVTVRTISATCFVATKLAAFRDRGKDDYLGSHDLEDIMTVVNGRDSLLAELEKEEPSLREFVAKWFSDLLGRQAFMDALPGHLEPDKASQQRLPQLLKRLKDIAALSKQEE